MVQASLGEAFIEIRASLDKLSNDLSQVRVRVDQSLSRVAASAARVGAKLSLAVTAPIIALGVATARAQSTFDKSMTQIISLVGVAADEVEKMKGSVLELSGETARSPAELADAMFFITSAGLRGKDAVDALASAAKASAVGLGETKVVADALTSAMNAYGKQNLSSAKATGILLAAVREGKLEASDLAGAIGRVIPFAEKLKVPFSDVAATAAAMSLTGTQARESMTALRGLFTAILRPSEQARQELEGVGLTFAQLRSELVEKGLLEFLTTLTDKFRGNEEALARLFPEINALIGVFSLTGENAKRVAEIFSSLSEAGEKDLNRSVEVLSNSIDFKLEKAMNDLRITMTRIGGITLPLVVRVMQNLAEIVSTAANTFAGFSPEAKRLALGMTAIALAAGPVLLAFSTITTAIRGLVAVLAGLLTGFSGMILRAVAVALFLTEFAKGARSLEEAFEGVKKTLSDLIELAKTNLMLLLEELIPDAAIEGMGNLADEIARVRKEIEDLTSGGGQEPKAGSDFVEGVSVVGKALADDMRAAQLELRILRGEFQGLEPDAIRAAEAAGVLDQAVKRIGDGAEGVLQVDLALLKLSQDIAITRQIQEEQTAATQRMESAAQSIGLAFSSAFEDAVIAGTSFSDVLRGLISDIQRMAVRLLILEPILERIKALLSSSSEGGGLFGGGGGGGDIFSSILSIGGSILGSLFGAPSIGGGGSAALGAGGFRFGSSLGGLAEGGDLLAGQPAIIGEVGPELWVPSHAGTVHSNDSLEEMVSGGGVHITQNIQIAGIEGMIRQVVVNQMARSREEIVNSVRAEALTGSRFKEAFD